jgi:pimeloyl-ACP methyl ester carboxylesterase
MAINDYVISTRRVRKGSFDAEPGNARFLKIPGTAKVPLPRHEISEQSWATDVQGLADGDQNPLSISPTGDVLFFIHGYNNNLDVIMKRQRQLGADLRAEGWRGVVVAFDWPSDNDTLNYLEDRWDAAEVAMALVERGVALIADGRARGCETNIHVLAHSTGAYVTMEACAQAEKDGNLFKSAWRLGQVAFVGGDISSASLAEGDQWAQPMFRRIMRLTNYSNPYDSVLGVSNAKRLGTAPRAGRVGIPDKHHPKVIDVACGDYFKTLNPKKSTYFGTFSHSWHIGNRIFARDLAMTLEGAIDRHAIPTRRADGTRLTLQDASRPKYQAEWRLESQ